MPTQKFTSIKARAIRLTTLDACGNPIIGTQVSCSLVSQGFVSVTLSADKEDGEDFTVKNAWGEFCVTDKDPGLVKRFTASIEFCEVDPEMLAMLTGGRSFAIGTFPTDTAIGGTFGQSVGADFALELWSKVAGGACAGAAYQYIYWVLPHLNGGTIGDLTFENGPLTMTVEDAGTYGASTSWGAGLYQSQQLPSALTSTEHVGYVLTATAPPAVTSGCTDLIAATSVGTPFVALKGTWAPAGAIPPASVADLIAGVPNVVTATPATNWTAGQYAQTRTPGVAGQAHWNGTTWVSGPHP